MMARQVHEVLGGRFDCNLLECRELEVKESRG